MTDEQRTALRETVEAVISEAVSDPGDGWDDGNGRGGKERRAAYIAEIMAAVEQAQPQWVPCSEAMPEPNVTVWLWWPGLGRPIIGWNAYGIWRNAKYEEPMWEDCKQTPTHWQPYIIPAPPEVEA